MANERKQMNGFLCSAMALALVAAASGCTEAQTDGSDSAESSSQGGGENEGGRSAVGSSVETVAATSTASTTSGAGGASQGVVLNEVAAERADWVELYNSGTTAVELSGMRIADAESAGVPKLNGAVVIPEGTVLEAGEYLFVLGGQEDAPPGFQDACDPGPAPCLQAEWRISKDGDEIFLLGEQNVILGTLVYQGGATDEGEAWGQVPDGSGRFVVTLPTPGAANSAI